MSPLLTELNSRWRRVFNDLDAGADVPPGLRLRTEGLMEAVALVGELSRDALQAQMDAVYCEINGQGLGASFGEDWRDFFPFPQIPAMGKRAPVFPSTRSTD